MITLDRLKELLSYDPETGLWTRLVSSIGRPAGSIAGTLGDRGYIRIMIDGKSYRASRLAWFYMTGDWPAGLIDHEDRDRTNNRWRNLRAANYSQNRANSSVRADNILGVKGVSRTSRPKPFRACIQVNGKQLYLGYFETPELASSAYEAAARKYFGEFARVE